jgi:hypothetical protein
MHQMVHTRFMKRATITVTDDLEPALEAYLRDQEIKPSLTRLLQMSLREFLTSRGYLRSPAKRSSRPSSPPPRERQSPSTATRPPAPQTDIRPFRPSEETDTTLL